MRIALWGGMHGPPESLGLRLVDSLLTKPIEGVTPEVANELAVRRNVRYLKHNLAQAFPGDKGSSDYEVRRAAELLEGTSKYDVVLDIHDNICNDRYIRIGKATDPKLLNVAILLGIDKAIVGEPTVGNICNYAPNVLTVELHTDDTDRSISHLRACLRRLSLVTTLPERPKVIFEYYREIEEIKVSRAHILGLKNYSDFKAFEKLPSEVNQTMGIDVAVSLYAEYWNGSNPSNGEYFGSILQSATSPFSADDEKIESKHSLTL